MDFTREPVIETVITPREGCKLVVRSSKSSGQEEYFVDAVEVVSFGHSLFFRSLERPKAFLVPVSDYEILEVREARMVLKNVGVERSIKIGGGREPAPRLPKEVPPERTEPLPLLGEELPALAGEEAPALVTEGRLDKKRDRRRHYRRRRGREEVGIKEGVTFESTSEETEPKAEVRAEPPKTSLETAESIAAPSIVLSSILPPPPTLISETIARYKDNAMFKGAFFVREEKGEGETSQPGEESHEESRQESHERSHRESQQAFHEESQEESQKEPEKQAWISDEAEDEIFRHRATSLTPEEPQTDEPATPQQSADSKEGHNP